MNGYVVAAVAANTVAVVQSTTPRSMVAKNLFVTIAGAPAANMTVAVQVNGTSSALTFAGTASGSNTTNSVTIPPNSKINFVVTTGAGAQGTSYIVTCELY